MFYPLSAERERCMTSIDLSGNCVDKPTQLMILLMSREKITIL